MKVTGRDSLLMKFSGRNLPDTDLKTITKRKTRNKKWKRVGGTPVVGRRSRPETPLLKWKVDEKEKRKEKGREVEEELEEAAAKAKEDGVGGRRQRGKGVSKVSARKLAAGLWRLQLPEAVMTGGGEKRSDRLGLKQPGKDFMGVPFHYHHKDKIYGSEDPSQSPSSVSGTKNGLLRRIQPSMQSSNTAMEGATKWDPVCLKTTDEARKIYSQMKRIDQQVSAVSVVSALEAELKQARAHIEELETERRSSKKKLEHFLRKVSEERAAWRSREHEKIRVFVDDVKADLNREKKKRQRHEIVNSKLVNELAAAKLSAKQYMQDYEKERKARELIEEVCDELAKEIGEDKAEVEEIKRDSMKLRDELDEERKMLQMAEVWREERVQMKLIDAKVALEERYSQMNKLIADLETYLRSRTGNLNGEDMRGAESLRQSAESVNVEEVKEFTYDPSNPDDIFAVFEDVALAEANERRTEPCTAYSPVSHASKSLMVSPEMNMMKKDSIVRHSTAHFDQNDEIEEDESGWETVSHIEDQGSSYSPGESAASMNRNRRDSNFSYSGTEWEENAYGGDTPNTEISEVCSLPARRSKKGSSIARLWRSGPNNGETYKIISVRGANGRPSIGRKSYGGGIVSPDRGSSKGGLSPSMGHWSSPDSGHPHIKGMKGCIDWPRGAQKNSLKAKLLEARMESQKLQLKHVLEQKI